MLTNWVLCYFPFIKFDVAGPPVLQLNSATRRYCSKRLHFRFLVTGNTW